MKPKPQPGDEFELVQAHFDQILNREHALVQLADKIDWSRFDAALADSYREGMGAPAKVVRLMVGLQYLKYTFNESDESVVDRWIENVYWQYLSLCLILVRNFTWCMALRMLKAGRASARDESRGSGGRRGRAGHT